MVDHAIHHWGIAKKEPALRVAWGPDGCINDTLQTITGATSGNGRLDTGGRQDYVLSWEGRSLRFRPREGLRVEEILSAELGEVMGVGESEEKKSMVLNLDISRGAKIAEAIAGDFYNDRLSSSA